MGNHTATRARGRSSGGASGLSRAPSWTEFEQAREAYIASTYDPDLRSTVSARRAAALDRQETARLHFQAVAQAYREPSASRQRTSAGKSAAESGRAQRAQDLGGTRGAQQFERSAIDLSSRAAGATGREQRALENQAALAWVRSAQARNESYEHAAVRWTREDIARRVADPTTQRYMGEKARLAAARSELTRYSRGEYGMPTPRAPGAKETRAGAENRLRADAYRTDHWLAHGYGVFALPSQREAAQDQRDHLYDELTKAMNARAARSSRTTSRQRKTA